MSHDHVPLTEGELTVEALTGAPVYGPEHEKVGTVGDLLLYDADNTRMAIVDVGGFLGLGAKHIAVPFDSLHFVHDGRGGHVHAHISWTKEELQAQPEFIRPDESDDSGYVVYVPPIV